MGSAFLVSDPKPSKRTPILENSMDEKTRAHIHDPAMHVICRNGNIAFDLEDPLGCDRWRLIRGIITFKSTIVDFKRM
jgi:hypothetical protein